MDFEHCGGGLISCGVRAGLWRKLSVELEMVYG